MLGKRGKSNREATGGRRWLAQVREKEELRMTPEVCSPKWPLPGEVSTVEETVSETVGA